MDGHAFGHFIMGDSEGEEEDCEGFTEVDLVKVEWGRGVIKIDLDLDWGEINQGFQSVTP